MLESNNKSKISWIMQKQKGIVLKRPKLIISITLIQTLGHTSQYVFVQDLIPLYDLKFMIKNIFDRYTFSHFSCIEFNGTSTYLMSCQDSV